MITKWSYINIKEFINEVKNNISNNNYTSIDIGAYAQFWSYPECKTVADIFNPNYSDVEFIYFNIQDKSSYNNILKIVENRGKFDYSICSHTLEDVNNPLDLLDLLPKISKRGYIACPSKYHEFSFLQERKYRGHAHHKNIIDVKNEKLIIYPKCSFIEKDERTDLIREKNDKHEIVIFWEDSIPFEYFAQEKTFTCDEQLINAYFEELA
jgi:hypothetical protein